MKPLLIVSVLALASLSSAFAPGLRRDRAAQGTQTFVGMITDDMCATKDGHATMRMGPTDAECTTACVAAHGADYVLADGKNVYTLSDQKTPEKLAGKKVRVTGTLDTNTKKIQVASMTLAQ
jgi:type 1 fimbria pilin